MSSLTRLAISPQTRSKPWVQKELPTFYYHTNFCQMLDFVDARYVHVFDEATQGFLDRFSALSFEAQCLFVRLAGRKDTVFNLSKLSYPELPPLSDLVQELKSTGFISDITPADFQAYIEVLTKPDLFDLLRRSGKGSHIRASWAKPKLLEQAEALCFTECAALIGHDYIVQNYDEVLQFLSFLYFGRIESNYQRFTLRDLGLISVPDHKNEYGARFDTPEAAHSAFFYAKAINAVRHKCPKATPVLISTLDEWPDAEGSIAQQNRDKLVRALGRTCERDGDTEQALAVYDKGTCSDSLERILRLQYAKGETEWCKARLEALIDHPDNDQQLAFAEDFYARKFGGKRTSVFTDMLREGESVTLDAAFTHRPEYAAAQYLRDQGYEVYACENAPWRMLFGLLFWDLLYERDGAEIFDSFQRIPSDLRAGRFYDNCQEQIDARLATLTETPLALKHMLKIWTSRHGRPNGIFRWRQYIFDIVQIMLRTAPAPALSELLRHMARDYQNYKDGFPDLICIKDSTLKAIEVKSEGDVIRRNQLLRIRALRKAGFDVEILNLKWGVNPDQTYVVVDVETTGGKAPAHRVTEIGAVKVRQGKIIDEFSSLINPERHIPAHITRLTGISDNMVKDAPVFAKVATELHTFLEGSVFVAHNVNFDYGFIKAEFGRLGQSIQLPKLCTVRAMRKYYPGLKSYGLANLSREFNIDLKQHHRALSDARAAAELLLMVNDKREVLKVK